MDEQAALEFRKTRAAPPALWTRVRRLVWATVQGTLFRLSFHTSNRWRAFLLRCFGAEVGPGCTIRRTARVYYPWNLKMGAVSCLGDRAEVYNLGPITIGDRVVVSQEAYLCAGSHDYNQPTMPLLTPPITIGDDAWIGARAFVYPNVKVGAGAIVAAAAVAVRDVPAWTIVGGNPAAVIKARKPFESPP